jgi:hypothetical protein
MMASPGGRGMKVIIVEASRDIGREVMILSLLVMMLQRMVTTVILNVGFLEPQTTPGHIVIIVILQ